MCGIAGVVALREGLPPIEIDDLTGMAGALRHRGPDEFGVYRDLRAGLAHARLSIIDLSTGQQPLSNETGTLWIVFNGEIFNYIELRQELEGRGHVFATKSDTEVIVHAYEEWADGAFSRFNGQWALALWDSESSKLVLARDPFGVRPLYLAEHHGRIYFASEVKAIFAASPDVPRRIDPIGLDQILTFWTTVAPRTVFEGVEELQPGTVRTYERGRVHNSFSYSPSFPAEPAAGFRGTLDDAVAEVRSALEQATELRMLRADVQVGSYLSGGLDSSLIAALGLRAKGSRFSTFSLRFADAEYDETVHQRAMAQYLGSDHHEVMVSRADIAAAFPEVVAHTERPILRTAPAPMFLLSRLVRDAGIKVVLTGEGADEMFAGYDLFREAKVRRFWAKMPASTKRPRLLERLYPYLDRSPVARRGLMQQFFGQQLERFAQPGFGHEVRWRGAQHLKRFLSDEVRAATLDVDAQRELLSQLPAAFASWSPLAQDQYLEVHTLLSGYLLSSQGDRMLMANSVEGRFPFLDRNVAALAESLPPAYKLRVLDEKHVLKRVGVGLVPSGILDRKKQPYRSPDALAFSGAGAAGEWIADVTSADKLKDAGLFRPESAAQLIRKCLSRGDGQFSNADNMACVGILSAQLVHEQFVRVRPAGRAVPLRTAVDRVAGAAPSLANTNSAQGV